jgi:hypothetical protein
MTEESLFAAALQKPAGAERQAFLDETCGGDAALRERVERLLAADEQSVGILERPDAPPAEPALIPGRIFAGRFKLRQKLDSGGMGEVWVADQFEPVQRRVAIKVVRPGFDSEPMLARFEHERQALALMDHPNIAKVLDAGAADGRPYFVMELIKGVPITRYCDEAKLSPRERLRRPSTPKSARSSARWNTCRPSRRSSTTSTSTPAATFTRWGRSSTSCSPVACRFRDRNFRRARSPRCCA